ncbi:MAG: hypothetical protein CMO30_15110 [Tistrella sp.]|nr:hypothetical protein [Tistrella sp.]MBA75362.1 hypothetical protein [Tistrella sp.]MBA76597.1 hypothetical protein [Tistrella sp.]
MSNNTMSYATKIEARRARLEAAADRAEVRADAAYKCADLREEASGIPFGQPILVGHHSEARHRRAIEKANHAMRTCITERDRADALRAKAAAVGTGGISADDPEAVSNLTEQLRAAQATQVLMKTANALVRKGDRDGLVKLGLSAAE